MRVIGSAEFNGVEYQAVWGSRPSVEGEPAGSNPPRVLAVRSGGEKIEAVIPRNARLPDVESAIGRLRALGLKDAQLGRLFNYKGSKDGLAQHVKMLVSSLR